MTPFEEQLKEALVRKERTQDFANRVLEKAKEQHLRAAVRERWTRGDWEWRFARVTPALILVRGAAMYHEHQQTVSGEMAKEQLLIAVRIAGSKLQDTKERVM